MRKLLCLVLASGLSGCLVVDDGYDHHHYVPPAPQPLPLPTEPPVYRLDCSWLATWNCWDAAVAEAAECAPQTYAGPYGGAFADYGYSCVYPDGSAVYFEDSVTRASSPDYRWSFTMEDPGGNTCGWFAETDTSLSIGTASGVVDFVVDGRGVSVTCQNGTQWYNPDPYALTYCAGYDIGSPGFWRESSYGLSSFGLLGADQPVLWSCGW